MKELQKLLEEALGKKQVFADDLTLTATAADASCYQKLPELVLKPRDEQDVIQALRILHDQGIPLTFRAAGTSLSGQALSDSVLLEARGDQWMQVEILEEGRLIRTQPGITGTRLNQLLAPTGKKFGPDPASINSAMVGGIIANNASGMSCGIHANAYATIQSARIIFADGTLLDTGNPESCRTFLEDKAGLVDTLKKIRENILSRPELVEKIQKKYLIKNTTGYGMNSFLDYEDPVDMVLHLMVGSEGTLGFISEASFRTVPVKPFRASSLIYFKDLESACNAVPALREIRIPAIEIMDREALRSVEGNAGIPVYIRDLDPGVTALLIDLEAESQAALENMVSKTEKALTAYDLVRDFEVSTDARQIADFWNVRKGVFPSVGGMRKPGTSVIIEDVAVPAEHLTEAVMEMRSWLDSLDYKDAVIYGHVLDGNLHFIFAQDFHDPAELKKYKDMIFQLTRLIVDTYDGSLKAEHGTGLNMAPFVAYEWGDEIYAYMKEIKAAFDPTGILNPQVMIADDPELHLKDFKPMPLIDDVVDPCIECGFCEINCLTNGLTLSARQRIVVQREIVALRRSGKQAGRLQELEKAYRYEGNDSCAGDGLCAISCPLGIDTGQLIKHLRAYETSQKRPGNPVATWMANHFSTVHRLVNLGLGTANLAGNLLPVQKLWIWDRHMPRPIPKKQLAAATAPVDPTASENHPLKVVYFPSCINQSMGSSVRDGEKRPLVQITREVLENAGYQVLYPENMGSLCCGTPWESKGFFELADAKSSQLEEALLKVSDQGSIPVLCDTSPCTHRMKRVLSDKLDLYEPVEFIHDHLLNKLKIKRRTEKLTFHVTCTSTKMGLREKFENVAHACAEDALFPEEVGCCGFAGDKGFTQPEINSWALRKLKVQVSGHTSGYSNSRTCEIGLSRNSGINYKSIMYLLHSCMDQEL